MVLNMPKIGYTEQEKEALKEYLKSGKSTRDIQDEYGVNKSKLSRMKKKYEMGELVLNETSETKTKLDDEITAPIKKILKENSKPKKKTLKVPELDEIIIYFRENKEMFPTMPESFETRIAGNDRRAGRDRWIAEAVLKVIRTMVGD
jgi:transposase-like protein